jgi:hypothetical protein
LVENAEIRLNSGLDDLGIFSRGNKDGEDLVTSLAFFEDSRFEFVNEFGAF